MKYRYGFVSNSSSSSFVIWDTKQTTSQVMLQMLELVRKEHEEEEWKEGAKAVDKVIKWLKKNLDFDKPLLYPNTCNYETWIWKDASGNILIDTCNNHDCNWESMSFGNKEGSTLEDFELDETIKFLDLTTKRSLTAKKYNDEWDKEFEKKFGRVENG